MPTLPSSPLSYLRRSALLPQVEMRHAYQSAACYDTHSHDEACIGVVDEGVAMYRNHHLEETVRSGATVLINPGVAHACNPDLGQRWSYRMLFIDAAWLGKMQADVADNTEAGFMPFSATSSRAPGSYRAFHQLFQVLEDDTDALAADEALLLLLAQHSAPPHHPPSTPGQNLQRAKELILDQLCEPLRLEAIADAAGLSRYHLVRAFKAAYGQTPHAFLLDQRINRGKHLLKRGDTLVQVAQTLGFADQSHFQRHFKHRHAVTPGAYQQALL
jgi:AraC-like DNA-binding protein